MKKKKSAGILKRILTYTKPYGFYLVGAAVCALISVSLTLLLPVLVGRAIDYIIEQGNVDFGGVLTLCVYMLISIGIVALFQWLMGICTSVLSYRTVRDMRKEVFRKLNHVPLNFIDTHPHGDIISRVVNDTDVVGDGLLQGFTQLFSGVVTILGTLGFMLFINYKIALLVFLITPLSLFVAIFIARLSSKFFTRQSMTQGELSSSVEEMVANQKLIIAFSGEEKVEKDFEEINSRLYTWGEKSQFSSSLSNPSTRLVNTIVYTAVGVAGALSVLSGGITVGTVSVFLTYANQYTKPFNEITGVIGQIQTAFAGAKRVFNLLDQADEPPEKPQAKTIEKAEGKVDIKNISFSYVPKRKLIENFSLQVKPGQNVAIVGPTGSGKSTLMNLLMRFYELNKGDILVDGISIQDITRDSLRLLYGMVLQDSWLYDATIAENIAYGKPNATREEIIEVAKSAYAHNFIMRMDKGYDTYITEDGDTVSQGQKQLLCIARVLLCNPSMLLLDEATSSIDTLTERRVQKAFTKMMEGKTSFIVAHRLSTIKNADIILVLKDGNIEEQGTHEELLLKKGFYYTLYNSQFAPS